MSSGRRKGGVGRKKRNAIKQKDLDAMFSKIIRSRGRCEMCGSTERLQTAHLMPRGYRATRWDEDNAWVLCGKDHVFYTHRPIQWEILLETKLGRQKVLELRHRALNYAQPDYKAIYARLKARLKAI